MPDFLGEGVRTRRVIIDTLQCVSVIGLNQDANICDKCRFRHVEADGQTSKKSKKSGGNGSVALLQESVQFGCASQDSHHSTRSKIGIKFTPSNSPRARGNTKKKLGKERVHREASYRSVNFTCAIRALPSLRRGHKTKLCTKKDAPAE